MRITREVEVEIDVDELLEDIDSDVLIAELTRRHKEAQIPGVTSSVTLQTIFEEFQRRGDAPKCLRDYLYDTLGRVLP
jgi:hypothetical protein